MQRLKSNEHTCLVLKGKIFAERLLKTSPDPQVQLAKNNETIRERLEFVLIYLSFVQKFSTEAYSSEEISPNDMAIEELSALLEAGPNRILNYVRENLLYFKKALNEIR